MGQTVSEMGDSWSEGKVGEMEEAVCEMNETVEMSKKV